MRQRDHMAKQHASRRAITRATGAYRCVALFVSKPDSWGRRALSLAMVGYAIAVAFGNGASRTVAGDLAIAMAMAIAWISSGKSVRTGKRIRIGPVSHRDRGGWIPLVHHALRACGDVGTFSEVAAG